MQAGYFKKISLITAILIIASPQLILAKDLIGRVIMDKVFNRDDGKDGFFKIEMILKDKAGNARRRLLDVYTKDYNDLTKTFLKFTEPADIAGTSFLSWENQDGDDTQYLYLPALGRARRIVSSQKNLRFVNTDFTYEDMQRRRPQNDDHRVLSEEVYNGYKCYVIENIPKEGISQYTKRVSWVDKVSLVILKIDFYGKQGKKIKEFSVGKMEKIQNIWTALETMMEDINERHTTVMKVQDVNYNQGLDDEIFTVRNMEKQ